MDEEKKIALAEFLGVEPETLTENPGNYGYGGYETEDGEVYIVATDEEADDLFRDELKSTYDDLGLQSFSEEFQEYICENCIDPDAFWDDMNGMNSSYCSDIAQEDDSQFGNRLVQECYDREIIGDDDFEKGEDGEPDYTNCIYDTDELIEKMTEDMNSDYSNSVDYMIDQFGIDEVSTIIKEHPELIDFDEVVRQVQMSDGRGSIASYDGKEQEQDGFYIYRIE